jgi:hypothetical protein
VVVASLCVGGGKECGSPAQKARTATSAAGIPPWTHFANSEETGAADGDWLLKFDRLVVFGQIF